MKYAVKIEAKLFEVEIDDLDARPVRVQVDGEWLEVWPEAAPGLTGVTESSAQVTPPNATQPSSATGASHRDYLIRAPLPGTIVNILVKAGDEVAAGQELLVLEAMKMKNTIRSPRSGRIGAILVSLGQTVKHQETLFEFAE